MGIFKNNQNNDDYDDYYNNQFNNNINNNYNDYQPNNNTNNKFNNQPLYNQDSNDDNFAFYENGNSSNNKRFNPKIIVVVFLVIILAFLIIYLFKIKNGSSESPIILKLVNDTVEIKVGEKEKIEYSIEGNKSTKITFSSSNNLVATVDENGTITGVNNGTAYVFVTYIVGGNKQGKALNVIVGDGKSTIVDDKVLDSGQDNDTEPTCTLNVKSDGTVTATPSSNAVKYGFSANFRNGNEKEYKFVSNKVVGVTKFDIMPVEYYVENASGKTGKCSVIIEMTCKDLVSDCTFRGI